jgi:hypothetical protein
MKKHRFAAVLCFTTLLVPQLSESLIPLTMLPTADRALLPSHLASLFSISS